MSSLKNPVLAVGQSWQFSASDGIHRLTIERENASPEEGYADYASVPEKGYRSAGFSIFATKDGEYMISVSVIPKSSNKKGFICISRAVKSSSIGMTVKGDLYKLDYFDNKAIGTSKNEVKEVLPTSCILKRLR